MSTTRVTAVVDPDLWAVLSDLEPIVYAGGGSERDDVPAHVQAASSIRRVGTRLVIAQDDVNVLALHAAGGDTRPLLLPAGPGGRRALSKREKMDLEACAVLPDGRLVALGSGSTAARERIVVVSAEGGTRIVDGAGLYAALRAQTAFSGSELNVEGVLVVGDAFRLFQRSNGAPRGGLSPVDATCDLPLPALTAWLDGRGGIPEVRDIVQYDLGTIDGVRFGFTDAALAPGGGVAFIAVAEDSPDAVRDGEVLGCRFGVLTGGTARTTDVVGADGRRAKLKLEGIEPRPDAPGTFDVVADMDRPDEPAMLGRLRVSG